MLAKSLEKNDLIGIVAPASGEDAGFIKEKMDKFRDLGFNIIVGEHVYSNTGYFAGEAVNRADDLMKMFKNKEVKAIICLRGGYGCINILPYLNYDLIGKNPKILCGYSDITLLLNYITKKTKLITFHSPMVNSNFEDVKTLDSFKHTIMKGNKPYSISIDQMNYLNSNKNITGILAGGNLSMLCSSIGTPYEVDFQNKILLMEDINEPPYAIDRMLTQLLLSGKLHKCKGFILGHFTGCQLNDYTRSYRFIDIINRILTPLKKPIIVNFPFGHDYPNITLPIGTKVTLDFKNNFIHFLDKVVF